MMNFMMPTYVSLLRLIDGMQQYASSQLGLRMEPGEHRTHFETDFKAMEETATKLELRGVLARLERIRVLLTKEPLWTDCGSQLAILKEAFEDDTQDLYLYVYPPSKVRFLIELDDTWGPALTAFSSIGEEIANGVDCFALGHNTACVFHMCRVGEEGLRIIGRERGVAAVRRGAPIEWGTWGQVFEKLAPHIEDIRKKANGPKRDAALSFYDPVVSDLRAIQSLYRDQTMHLRDSYDDGEAQSAIFRTRELMLKLATKLNDRSTVPIDWGL